MKKTTVIAVMIILSQLALLPAGYAEKLKFATGVKVSPVYYLPMLAADEQGFWKKNALDAEWMPFAGAADMFRTMAAGHVGIGFSGFTSVIEVASRGLPVSLVSDLYSPDDFPVWVRNDGPIRKATDLKGLRIGVSRLSGTQYLYALAMTQAEGLRADVKVAAFGPIPNVLAALRAGAVDAVIQPLNVMIDLKVRGQVREIATKAYIPSPWVGFGTAVYRDLAVSKPDTVRKSVRAVLEATNFIKDNPGWSIKAMKSFSGFSEEAATILHKDLRSRYTGDGKFTKEAVENVRNFLIDFGVIPKEKVPPIDKLYTHQFLQ